MQYAPHITDLSTAFDASFLYMISLSLGSTCCFIFSLTSWTLRCRLAPKLGLSRVPFWRFMLHFQTFMEAEAELHSSELFSTKWSNVIGRRRALKPWHQYSEPLLRQAHRQTGRKRLKLAAEKQQSSVLQHHCAFSRPAAGPRPHFGLLLIKPIVSWNVFLVVFAVCQHVWSRECVSEPVTERVCVSSIKFKRINHSHREITPPRVIAVIDLSIIHTNNSWSCSTSWSPRKHSPGTNTMLAISWGCHEMQ